MGARQHLEPISKRLREAWQLGRRLRKQDLVCSSGCVPRDFPPSKLLRGARRDNTSSPSRDLLIASGSSPGSAPRQLAYQIHHIGQRVPLELFRILRDRKGFNHRFSQRTTSGNLRLMQATVHTAIKRRLRPPRSWILKPLLRNTEQNEKQTPPDPPYWTARCQRLCRSWVL